MFAKLLSQVASSTAFLAAGAVSQPSSRDRSALPAASLAAEGVLGPPSSSRDRSSSTAPLARFAGWLREAGETEAISSHQLKLLYGEFCLDTDTAALTTGRLYRRIGAAGIQRYREPVGKRRWFYRVRSEAFQGSAIEYAADAA